MAGFQGTSTRRSGHEALAAVTESERREINTTVDGEIVSYDRATQRATIKPKLTRRFGDKVLDAPNLEQVKIVQPKSAGGGVHVDLAAGDPVTVHFLQRNTDTSQTEGGNADGAPGRMHDLSDAKAYPGGGPDASVQTNMPAGGVHFGGNDGKSGIQRRADGSTAIVGGPSGGDKFTVDAAGKIDMKSESGDSLLQIIRDFLEAFRDHTNGGAPMAAPFIATADALIAKIDGMKA